MMEDLSMLEEQIKETEAQLKELRAEYREKRTAGLRAAFAAREDANRMIREEMKNLGYHNPLQIFR